MRLQSKQRGQLTARISFDFRAAYDELNPADDDYRFHAALAAAAGASRTVDLGCGTGTLARMLASGAASVTGIDPDPEMLRRQAACRRCRSCRWTRRGGCSWSGMPATTPGGAPAGIPETCRGERARLATFTEGSPGMADFSAAGRARRRQVYGPG
jgi:hypothetical protein